MSPDIAGVTLNAPAPSYGAAVEGFGHARLDRGHGRTFDLRLSPGASDRASDPPAGARTEVVIRGLRGTRPDVVAAGSGLRDLIVEHGLLSRPSMLWSRTVDVPTSSPAGNALLILREALSLAIDAPGYASQEVCSVCSAERPASPYRRGSLFVMSIGAHGSGGCAHRAERSAALRAITREHPELAFELIALITPLRSPGEARFGLDPETLRGALNGWLLRPEQRDRRRSYWDVLSHGPRLRPVQRRRATLTHADWADTPEATRVAVSFAAQAWSVASSAPRLAPRDRPTARFAEWSPRDALMPRELVVMVPDEFRAPVARPAPANAPTSGASRPPPAETSTRAKVATRKDAPAAKPATKPDARPAAKPDAPTKPVAAAKPDAPTTPVAPAKPRSATKPSNQLYTMKDLAAQGHGPAAVKRMLKDGALVRESFGWYRFTR